MATGTLHMPARPLTWRYAKKAAKRIIPLSLGLYFIPKIVGIYLCFGLVDVLRNRPFRISTLDRYFFGNGIFTWLLSPVNLMFDLLSLPYINNGIYQLTDLPAAYRSEIQTIIDVAHRRDIVGQLEKKMEGKPRGMMFFKWYGKNLDTSIDMPEYHEPFRYVRTIGVSVFSKKQSTGKHYGPLRLTLRVLYNVNTIDDRNVFIQVGDRIHYWRDEKLFIFDDTLQHQSCNESDKVRYCMFVDILRPSLFPRLTSALLVCIRVVISRFKALFYKHWTFLK
ncbi:MAG TPA: aspartyl/asparaginyl beta-hydroxylase domain-containing protein [Pirellulales bacterium]|nr:aspartyl/asparaginyl beta-hydroxylase domain-containing protein [Pirellulales bacterium]